MGRQSNDPIVTQSSIALLQERFRQLQRVKEMREERELHLHKMVVEPKLFSPAMQYDCYETSSRLFFHFLPTRTSTSSPQVSLSLRSYSQSKQQVQVHDDYFQIQSMETTPLLPTSETVPAAAAAAPPSLHASAKKFGTPNHHDDVDTSLHL
ncbi:hypothetical protein CISIN_1g031878mg [Citrus sinensis]|uniref:Uncharacterized protein n=1 Tax=Citrus sinensis TaxID=2711 RepID=A0A067GII8_CITSI|nr:hypothetical protein CISIN_1g031878mg [Citrus sinensis]